MKWTNGTMTGSHSNIHASEQNDFSLVLRPHACVVRKPTERKQKTNKTKSLGTERSS